MAIGRLIAANSRGNRAKPDGNQSGECRVGERRGAAPLVIQNGVDVVGAAEQRSTTVLRLEYVSHRDQMGNDSPRRQCGRHRHHTRFEIANICKPRIRL